MQNGWGGGPPGSQGATAITQWPPASPAGVIGGRGRGFVPGRGRAINTWSPSTSVNSSSSTSGQGSHGNNDGRVGVPFEDRKRTCFKCGMAGHLVHSCPGQVNGNVRNHNPRLNGDHNRDNDNDSDSGINSPRDSFHNLEKWGNVNPDKNTPRTYPRNSRMSCYKS